MDKVQLSADAKRREERHRDLPLSPSSSANGKSAVSRSWREKPRQLRTGPGAVAAAPEPRIIAPDKILACLLARQQA